ncbi:hypothetical protein ACFRCI_23405 [Streptomyces sp. NPDC056638]|uniref:hypothetical protein n=1 Tax=Streptomyces sp. NPDC056638 TaxID=3345887 RepID=UPI0036C92EC4
MPKTDGYGQGVQYPVLSDAPNIETAFQTAVNGLAALSVLRFANANERAATLTGTYAPRPGMITYLIAEDRWDRYDGDKKWRPLTAGSWKPLTFASGYTAFGGSPGYRIVNGSVELRGAFQRTNGADLVKAVETLALTIPAEARPATARSFIVSSTYSTTSAGVPGFSGRIVVRTTGEIVFIVGHAANFLYLDGARYSLD